MNILSNKLEKLIDLLIQSQDELLKSQKINLIKHYGANNVIGTEDYILAIGDIPIMLVAHLDTVYYELPTKEEIIITEYIISSPFGIGGDDRCGIYMINEIIERGYRPYVLFTTDEEIGCLGTKTFIKDRHDSYMNNLKYIIELDRRGIDDAVFYDCPNQKFIDYITSNYHWRYNEGTYSDISHICPHFDIAGVNLSVGYFEQHKTKEYIDFNVTNRNIEIVIKMLEDAFNINLFPYYR